MAFTHGIHAYFKLAAVPMSAYLKSIDVGFERQIAGEPHLGETWQTELPGILLGTLGATGDFDPTADAAIWAALTAAAATAWEYGPQGSGSGSVKYSGTCWLTKQKASSKGNALTSEDFDMTNEGTVSRGTY